MRRHWTELNWSDTYYEYENHYARKQNEKKRGERLVYVLERLEVEVSHQYFQSRQISVANGGESFYLENRCRYENDRERFTLRPRFTCAPNAQYPSTANAETTMLNITKYPATVLKHYAFAVLAMISG